MAHHDAVGVCAHEVGDPQLALFLARVLEGEQGPLQHALLTKHLVPGGAPLLVLAQTLCIYMHATSPYGLFDHHLHPSSTGSIGARTRTEADLPRYLANNYLEFIITLSFSFLLTSE